MFAKSKKSIDLLPLLLLYIIIFLATVFTPSINDTVANIIDKIPLLNISISEETIWRGKAPLWAPIPYFISFLSFHSSDIFSSIHSNIGKSLFTKTLSPK